MSSLPGRLRHVVRIVLSMMIGGAMVSGLHAQPAPFEIWQPGRSTFAATHPIEAGTILLVSAPEWKADEVLYLMRCGAGCDSATEWRSWRKKDFDRSPTHAHGLKDTGDYYFFLMHFEGRQRNAVTAETARWVGARAEVTYVSGTNLSIVVESPTTKRSSFDPRKLAEAIEQGRAAREAGDLATAEATCRLAFDSIEDGAAEAYRQYADRLAELGRPEAETYLAQAARFEAAMAHRDTSGPPRLPDLGFNPVAGVEWYAAMLSRIDLGGESLRMHALGRAFQDMQRSYQQRTDLARQHHDPRGTC